MGRKILLTFNEPINGRMKKGGRESASVKVSVAAFYLFACLAIIRRAYRKGQRSVILRDQAKDARRHVHSMGATVAGPVSASTTTRIDALL